MQENPHFLFNNGAWRIYFFVPCSTKIGNCNEKKNIARLPVHGSHALAAESTGGSERQPAQ